MLPEVAVAGRQPVPCAIRNYRAPRHPDRGARPFKLKRVGGANRNDVLRHRRPGGATPDPYLSHWLQAAYPLLLNVLPGCRHNNSHPGNHRPEFGDSSFPRADQAEAVLVLHNLISIRESRHYQTPAHLTPTTQAPAPGPTGLSALIVFTFSFSPFRARPLPYAIGEYRDFRIFSIPKGAIFSIDEVSLWSEEELQRMVSKPALISSISAIDAPTLRT